MCLAPAPQRLPLLFAHQCSALRFSRTWRLPQHSVEDIVYNALAAGYRAFDCAALYNNERLIGNVLRKCLNTPLQPTDEERLSVSREELFITSKLWNTHHRKDKVVEACNASLRVCSNIKHTPKCCSCRIWDYSGWTCISCTGRLPLFLMQGLP